jgi:hypothetical protein
MRTLFHSKQKKRLAALCLAAFGFAATVGAVPAQAATSATTDPFLFLIGTSGAVTFGVGTSPWIGVDETKVVDGLLTPKVAKDEASARFTVNVPEFAGGQTFYENFVVENIDPKTEAPRVTTRLSNSAGKIVGSLSARCYPTSVATVFVCSIQPLSIPVGTVRLTTTVKSAGGALQVKDGGAAFSVPATTGSI